MRETADMDLLQDYVHRNSDEAFATLVRRHLNMVYCAALRKTGNPHAAEEVAQAVFIILARKAGRLRKGTILSGWLYQTARLTSASYRRGEFRRVRREQEAYMQSLSNDAQTEVWLQIAPLLEDGMGKLNEKERNAVALRFFEGKSFHQIGLAVGATENAAKKRVAHALEKLRKFFAKRGVLSTTTIIAGAVAANSVHAAPPALAGTIAAAAVAKGTVASGSILTLIKGALKLMAWTKAKTAMAAGAAVLLAAGTTTVAVRELRATSAAPKIPKLSATDLSWADDPRYWATDSRVLEQLPAGVFIFRPTHFPNGGGGIWMNNRMMVRDSSVGDLMDSAYRSPYTRTVFPRNLPGERFDVLATLPGGPNQTLQNELRKRFNLTAHREERTVNVLLLKVRNPNPPSLKVSEQDYGGSWVGGDHEIKIANSRLDGFISNVETTLGVPVINQTDLDATYDLRLNWRPKAGETDKEAFRRALSEQLGLQLVPSRQPIEMLVVDPVK